MASALSLGSCVNEVKNPEKPQDTLSSLAIMYSIPDSNEILTVHFHAEMTPTWQKRYRIDWNFGDSTGIISKFDTINLSHKYQKSGSYLVTLSVFDTVSKTVLGKASITIDIIDNGIDPNFLHGFTLVDLSFVVAGQYNRGGQLDSSTYSISFGNAQLPIVWNGNSFHINDSHDTSFIDMANGGSSSYHRTRLSMGLHISHSGSQIDSGWYSFDTWDSIRQQLGIAVFNKGRYVQYLSLPRNFISKDSMVFFYSGSGLQSKIMQAKDSIAEVECGCTFPPTYPPATRLITALLWDKQPTPFLKIKLYR